MNVQEKIKKLESELEQLKAQASVEKYTDKIGKIINLDGDKIDRECLNLYIFTEIRPDCVEVINITSETYSYDSIDQANEYHRLFENEEDLDNIIDEKTLLKALQLTEKKKYSKKKRIPWSDDEVNYLLLIVSNVISGNLGSLVKTWKDIANEVNKKFFNNRSDEACRKKFVSYDG